MSKVDLEMPVLFYNDSDEARKAYYAMLKSGIPCKFRPPSADSTPMLLVGYTEYTGIQEIEEFIKGEIAQKIREKYKDKN